MALTPALPADVYFETSDGKSYLYNYQQSAYATLDNPTSVEIVSLVDGRRSVADICSEISRRHPGAAPATVVTDVTDMLATLKRESFISMRDEHGE